ncbi:MAG: hypothetical protein NWF04_01895 [Candidatus Bathyarchaeota archaeon]|nr:hypothetical protein [Candidatus Bathyarchaeota archaeon]
MTLKKSLNKIRGWLPKEPTFLNPQKTQKPKEKQQTNRKRAAAYIAVFMASFLGTFSLAYTLYSFGLGSYAAYVPGAIVVTVTLVPALRIVYLNKENAKISARRKQQGEGQYEVERKS